MMTATTARRALLGAALAGLAGCGPSFTAPSKVEGLRVLAVQAEPPEIAPASDGSAPSGAALTTLVAFEDAATSPARRALVLHVACTPSPGGTGATACTRFAELSDPAALLTAVDPDAACAAPGVGAAGAITFAGVERCGVRGCEPVAVQTGASTSLDLPTPAYRLPDGFRLDGLPAGAPERVLGVEVTEVALAIDPSADDPVPAAAADACDGIRRVAAWAAAAWGARPHVAAVKRIRVRGPEAPSAPNQNPTLDGITADGVAIAPPGGAPTIVAGRASVQLLPVVPDGCGGAWATCALRERYVRSDAAGLPIETRQEDWTFSWFSTAGTLKEVHTTAPDEAERLDTPTSGTMVLWTVVRDLRGGVAWTLGEVTAGP